MSAQAQTADIATNTRNKALDAAELTQLGKELGIAFQASEGQASAFLDDVQSYRDLFAGVLPAKENDWSANVNVPATEYLVKNAARQLAAKVTGHTPMYLIEPADEQYVDYTAGLEQFVEQWVGKIRLRTTASLAIMEALVTGQAWIKSGIRKTGKKLATNPMMQQQAMNPEQLDVAPTAEVVVTEDMLLVPFTAPSFDRARGAFAKIMLTWDDIELAYKSMYEDSVYKLKTQWAVNNAVSPGNEQLGITEWVPDGIDTAEFTCYEGFFKWRRGADKVSTKWYMLLACPNDTGDPIVLRCVPYEDVYDSCMFSPLINDPSPRSMWGRSMIAGLRDLQTFTNSTFSQMTDSITLTLLPPMAVPQGSDILRKRVKWGPMALIPVSNPSEIQPLPPAANLTAFGPAMNMMDTVRSYGERLTGTTDVTTGKTEENKRTAYEIGVVVESGNELKNYTVGILEMGLHEGDGLEGVAVKLVEIFNRYFPPMPIKYGVRKSGKMGWEASKPEWFTGNYRFSLNGSNQTWNPQVKIQRAMQTLEQLKMCPFAAYAPSDTPDIIVEKTQRMWSAWRDFLGSMGHRDPEVWIRSEPQTLAECLGVVSIVNPQMYQTLMLMLSEQASGGQPMPGMPGEAGMAGVGASPQDTGGIPAAGQPGAIAGGGGLQGAPPVGGMAQAGAGV